MLSFFSAAEPTDLKSPREQLTDDERCQEEWGITLEQENRLLEQFTDELLLETDLPASFDDNCLRRFLRARKHNIYKAKKMVLDTLAWRKELDVDNTVKNFDFKEKVEFHQHYPEGFYGTDRSGRPVYVQSPGNINTQALWQFTTMDRAITYHITQQERCVNVIGPSCSVASGRLHEESLVLIDMDGVGVSTITGEVRKIMGKIMQIDQDYYPELMWKALIINAPTSFRVIWGMIKYLLDSRTQAKINLLPVDFKEELQKYIAPENLLECYGGTNKTPLIDSPGPWQDAEIMAEVERRQALRVERKMGSTGSEYQ